MITLSIIDICVGLLTTIVIMGLVHLGFFAVRKWAINKTEAAAREQLNKFADITAAHNKTVNDELAKFELWVRDGFPSETAHAVLTDSNLMKFRNKGRISEAAYLESLESVVTHIQEIVTTHTNAMREVVDGQFIKDLKGLMDDRKAKKPNKE